MWLLHQHELQTEVKQTSFSKEFPTVFLTQYNNQKIVFFQNCFTFSNENTSNDSH